MKHPHTGHTLSRAQAYQNRPQLTPQARVAAFNFDWEGSAALLAEATQRRPWQALINGLVSLRAFCYQLNSKQLEDKMWPHILRHDRTQIIANLPYNFPTQELDNALSHLDQSTLTLIRDYRQLREHYWYILPDEKPKKKLAPASD